MPEVEITMPEHLEMQIVQLIERDGFVSHDEAIEGLLSAGIRVYKISDPMPNEDRAYGDDGIMGHRDGYVF